VTEQPSFRERLERLEAIVRELERSDVDLDRALALFEEGVGELREARALLADAELRVRKVIEDADGNLDLANPDD
jgi:exodeoxyribonuclease VII small subunit